MRNISSINLDSTVNNCSMHNKYDSSTENYSSSTSSNCIYSDSVNSSYFIYNSSSNNINYTFSDNDILNSSNINNI